MLKNKIELFQQVMRGRYLGIAKEYIGIAYAPSKSSWSNIAPEVEQPFNPFYEWCHIVL